MRGSARSRRLKKSFYLIDGSKRISKPDGINGDTKTGLILSNTALTAVSHKYNGLVEGGSGYPTQILHLLRGRSSAKGTNAAHFFAVSRLKFHAGMMDA